MYPPKLCADWRKVSSDGIPFLEHFSTMTTPPPVPFLTIPFKKNHLDMNHINQNDKKNVSKVAQFSQKCCRGVISEFSGFQKIAKYTRLPFAKNSPPVRNWIYSNYFFEWTESLFFSGQLCQLPNNFFASGSTELLAPPIDKVNKIDRLCTQIYCLAPSERDSTVV